MKTRLLLLVALALILSTVAAGAQEPVSERLTVYGKIRTFAQADRARITFKIKGVGKTLRAAFDDTEIRMSVIEGKLRQLGLDETNLATTYFQSGENFGDKAFLSSKRDYRVTMTAAIITDRMDLLEDCVVVLSESEVESIQDISFELTDYAALREAALARATDKARQKAETACARLGVVCGSVLEFEELKPTELETPPLRVRRRPIPFNEPLFYLDQATEGSATLSSIFPQEVRFDSEIRVVFEIVNSHTGETTGVKN